MVALFKKEDKKKTLSESERLELSRKTYELGFEVGYHKHSELGWVAESYSKLESFAGEHGLEELVSKVYSKGKEDGFQSKKRDMYTGLSREEVGDEGEYSSPSSYPMAPEKAEMLFESGFRSSHRNENTYAPIEKPTMTNLPEMTSMTEVIKGPTQLKGFEPLVPKR